MEKKLTLAVFLILSLAVISWFASAAVALEYEKDVAQKEKLERTKEQRKEMKQAEGPVKVQGKEVRIHRLQAGIQELEYALEHNAHSEKSEQWKASLQEYKQQLQWLRAGSKKAAKPQGDLTKIEMEIKQTQGNLREYRHAAKALQSEGGSPAKLEELQAKIAKREEILAQLVALQKKRRSEVRRTGLEIFWLKHANANNLSQVIEKFLTPEGIIAAHKETNSLIIKDSPAGLSAAMMIIKSLDVSRMTALRRDRDVPRGERHDDGERDIDRRERDDYGERDIVRRERDIPHGDDYGERDIHPREKLAAFIKQIKERYPGFDYQWTGLEEGNVNVGYGDNSLLISGVEYDGKREEIASRIITLQKDVDKLGQGDEGKEE